MDFKKIFFIGLVNTEVWRHLNEKCYGKCYTSLSRPVMLSSEEGAKTTLFCCLDKSIEEESGEYYEKCKKAKASKRARNKAEQKRLWKVSEKMVGLA